MTLDTAKIYDRMMALCRLQQQVDEIKAELEPFLVEGESFSCPEGKLTKCKGATSFTPNAEGKRKMDVFKEALEAEGFGKYATANPSLRLTLNKVAAAL